MTEAMEYSVGVDLSQTPVRYATAGVGGVELFTLGTERLLMAGEAPSADAAVEQAVSHVVAVVRQLAEERGTMPTLIAVGLAEGDNDRVGDITRMVAARLGLDPSVVQSLDASAARPSDAALAAALRGGWQVPGGAIAAGAAGVALGGGAAALVAKQSAAAAAQSGLAGPAGVALGSTAAVGPAGVSLGAGGAAGTAGVPIGAVAAAGPIGVPIGVGQATGPTGQPLTSPSLAGKLLRLPVVIGATVGILVVAVAIVVATRDDQPTTAPLSSTSAVVSTLSAAPETVTAPTTLVVTTAAPTSLVEVQTASSAACVVGSWVADNQAYLDAMTAASANIGIGWETATGVLRLDISADGGVVTTYEDWMLTSTLGGAGTAVTSVMGVDTNTVSFGDDGTYSVSATEIGSQMQVSSGGYVIRDGLSQDSLFRDASTFTCSGDRFEVLHHAVSDLGETDLVLVFARSG